MIRVFKTNGEVLNIGESDIERYVGKHSGSLTGIKKRDLKVVVDNNALTHRKAWNERASKMVERFYGHPVGIYGDAVVISND